MWFDGEDSKSGAGTHEPLITDPMATVTLQQVWEDMPRVNGLPLRADLDPLALGPLIQDCFIATRIAPGMARLRVAGRNLGRYTGTEARGLPLSVLFDNADRVELMRCLEMCFAEPALLDLPVEAATGLGKPPLGERLMLLPMRDGMGHVTKALGGLFVSGRVGRGVRRFRFDAALPKRKLPISAAAAAAESRRTGGRPALRLVVNNDT